MSSDPAGIHVVIIGAYGSAGVAVAEGLLDAPDVRMTLIDDGEPGGGLCILKGCMPSKEVISAGAHRYHARADHRLVGEPPALDLDAVYETKQEHVLGFAKHRRAAVNQMADRDDVRFIHDTARFIGPRTIAAGDERIEADYIVIATGSTVNIPPLPGIDDVDYMTSADVLDATNVPDSGIVMGFGYVGLELVPYLAEAGVDLTVIEHDDRPLDEADPAFGDTILELYRQEFGIEILTNTDERSVAPTADGGVELTVERDWGLEMIEADQLYLFTGRTPNVAGLDLDRAGLTCSPDWVRETMQSTDDDCIFIVGDANWKEPILHVAKEQGYKAAENILAHCAGDPLEPYENITHHVVFTGLGVYPYVRIGHTDASASVLNRETVTVTREATSDGIFKSKHVPHGHATLVVDQAEGTVLGYQGLHHHADVMAKTMQVIIELGLDVRNIPDRAFHPTTPELLDGLFREASASVEENLSAQ